MLTILTIAVFLMAAFDARLTARRISAYGPKVELNEAIANLSTRIGSEGAALLGIMLPNAIIIGLCYAANWPTVLAILAGFKIRYFWNQIQSLKFEKQIKAITKELNLRGAERQPSTLNDADASSSSHGSPNSSDSK